MNKEEMKFDHFKNVEELLEHIKIWYREDEVFYERWFGLNDLYKLGQYIETLQSQLDISNKKLEEINSVVRKIEDSPYLYWDNVQRILLSIIGGE